MMYSLTLTFEAANMDQAEDKAASVVAQTGSWARSSLSFLNPITGDWDLWSSPAMCAGELQMQRERP